jgi:hypothetical protein
MTKDASTLTRDATLPIKLYFYSNRNIIGTCGGILAAGLTALGFVHDFWPLLIAGSYGAGALLTPADHGTDVSLAREMTDQQIVAELAHLATVAQKQLPPTIAPDVQAICEMLSEAIPLAAKLQAGNTTAYNIRTTATEYLPDTLDRYLRMPKAFRNTVKDASGKTPTQMLTEQITLLKTSLTSMTADLASADADGIAANGNFLKEKFATPEFASILT